MESNQASSKHLGIVAGFGDMPVEIIKSAQSEGYQIACAALAGMARSDYPDLVDEVIYVGLGDVQKTIEFFLSKGIQRVFFAGKVDKKLLMQGQVQLDTTAQAFLQNLSQGNDDSMLAGIAAVFQKAGIEILDSTTFLKSILPEKGVLTKAEVPGSLESDIEFGYEMAKGIAGLDIGQTVVVKNGAVLAVEAIEGTDEAIRRGGTLGAGGSVVVKVAKPQQDLRFDVPTIGKGTLDTCIASGISVLAFDAGCTILLDREEVLTLAESNQIHLVSL